MYQLVNDLLDLEPEKFSEGWEMLYGWDNFSETAPDYAKNVISLFIKKKDFIFSEAQNSSNPSQTDFVFDVNNINNLFSIIFLKYYIEKQIDIKRKEIREDIIKTKRNIDDGIDNIKELDSEIRDLNSKIKKLDFEIADKDISETRKNELIEEKNGLEKGKNKKIQEKIKLSNEVRNLQNKLQLLNNIIANNLIDVSGILFDYTRVDFPHYIILYNADSLGVDLKKLIKSSIKCVKTTRNKVEHKESLSQDNELIIYLPENGIEKAVDIHIPISYIDGLNKGRIIARKEDADVLEKTRKAMDTILNTLGMNLKSLTSFFYNVEPIWLGYLLDICEYKDENLCKLPSKMFVENENVALLIVTLLEKNNCDHLIEEDYEFFNNMDNLGMDGNGIDIIVYQYLINYRNQLGINIVDIPNIFAIWVSYDKKIDIREAIQKYKKFIEKFNSLGYGSSLKKFYKDIPKFIKVCDSEETLDKLIKLKNKIVINDEISSKDALYWYNIFIDNKDYFEYLDKILVLIDKFENLYGNVKDVNKFISALLFKLKNVDQNEKIDDIFNWDLKIIYDMYLKSSERNPNKFINIQSKIEDRFVSYINADFSRLDDSNLVDNFLDIISDEFKIRKTQRIRTFIEKIIEPHLVFKDVIFYLFENIDGYQLDLDFFNRLFNYYDSLGENKESLMANVINNIDYFSSRVSKDMIFTYPAEIYFSNKPNNFSLLFYNSNMCRSILGEEDPRIVGITLYFNEVLSRYDDSNNKNSYISNLDILIDDLLSSCVEDTCKYAPVVLGKSYSKSDYMNQFSGNSSNWVSLKGFILNKFRNSSAHFRIKPVYVPDEKDKRKTHLEKVCIYDKKDESSDINFALVLDIKYFVELIRKIEIVIDNVDNNIACSPVGNICNTSDDPQVYLNKL